MYHEKRSHKKENKEKIFPCEHKDCNIKFKSKKHKLIHHNKMEPECENEKHYLIKLVKKYKDVFQTLIKEKKINFNFDDEKYRALKALYEKTQEKFLDSDYFMCLLGKDFESDCLNEEKVNNLS